MTAPGQAPSFVPHLLLLLMIAIWGGSYSAVKAGLDHLQPFALIAARFWLAVVVLLPFVRGGLADLRATVKPGAITGLALLCGYALQTIGMNETSSSMGGFLAGLIVPLVAVGGFVIFREPLTAPAILCLLLGIGGMVLLCLAPGSRRGPADTPRGMALQIGSSTCYALHIILISRVSPRGKEMAYCLWQLLVTAAGTLLLAVVTGGWTQPDAAPGPGLWAIVAYLGLFATALGIAVQSTVQPRIRPTHVALLFATQPIFAAIGGFLFLGDQLGLLQYLGGGLIVLGVIVAARR